MMALAVPQSVKAYDFSAVAPTGQTLYYIISDSSAIVTYPGAYYYYAWTGFTEPSGALIIPSSVSYNGETYSVTSIGENAFYHCDGLTSVTIPNSIFSIGRNAFENCTGMTSVSISNSVTSIGISAFYGCSGLLSINIPSSVTSIEFSAFYGCSNLSSITVESGNLVYDSRGNCNAIINTSNNTLVNGCKNTTFPNTVTSIGIYAFAGHSGLVSLTIPNNIIAIGEHAFVDCSGLTSITVAEGNAVFDSRDNCNGIIRTADSTLVLGCKNTVIPNTVTAIGLAAFCGCSGLTSISFPNSVSTIYSSAFEKCTGLTSVTIPDNINTIGVAAFYGCSSLNTVYYNAVNCSVISSGASVFGGCGNFTLNIGEDVYAIPNRLFEYSNLTTVNFNAINCTLMGDDYPVFSGCNALSTVNIGNNVTTLPDSAFARCTGLTTVNYNATNCYNMGNGVYSECPRFTILNIGNNVQTIPASAFSGCTALSTAVVGNGVTAIPSKAFNGCNHITHLTLGSRVQTIAADAFSGCNAVLRLTSLATVPPTAPSNPFTNFNTSIPVYVPCNSVDAYKNAAYWGFFSNIQCDNAGIEYIDGESINIYSCDGRIVVDGADGESVQVYNMTGHSVGCERLPTGTYMVRVGNHPARKVVVIR